MAEEITVTSSASPRFEGDTLKWFCGNTFPYSMEIALLDGDTGESIIPSNGDRITVRFYDARNNLVHNFDFPNLSSYKIDDIDYVEIVMNFNEDVSSKFKVGKYKYCVTYYGEYVTTLWDNAEAIVEKCH